MPEKAPIKRWRTGIYCLRIHPTAQQISWQHGVTLVSAGDDVCIYQGWVKCYTLLGWLTVNPPATCHAQAFHSYSPGSQTFVSDPAAQLDRWLTSLGNFRTGYETNNWTDVAQYGQDAFGVTLGEREIRALRQFRELKYKLEFEWKFSRLKGQFTPNRQGYVALSIGSDDSQPPASSKCCC
jgi:hypothetical protein